MRNGGERCAVQAPAAPPANDPSVPQFLNSSLPNIAPSPSLSVALVPWCLCMGALLVAGCGEPMPAPDAGGAMDASGFDARVEQDAGTSPDAWMLDASVPDSSLPDGGWGACSVDGVAGECIDVSACDGERMAVPGHCPGPASIQCCVPMGSTTMCDPAVMPTPNEGLTEEAGEDGCPSGMVRVTPDFCVDRFEASLMEIRADGSEASWSPFHNPGTRRMRAVSLRGAVPQGYITGVQAAAACSEAGKRLCTDTEWLRACQGSAGTTYPYGATRMTGVCNDHRDVHPAVERFGTSADWIWSRLGDACINQLPMSLALTGDYEGCESESGALDMMGNLHEWTADPAGTFRGGFYVDTVLNGNGCLYRTTAHDTGHWDYSTGFRCCWSE